MCLDISVFSKYKQKKGKKNVWLLGGPRLCRYMRVFWPVCDDFLIFFTTLNSAISTLLPHELGLGSSLGEHDSRK